MTSKKLLKRYIREVLKEEGDHAGFTAGDIMAAGMAMNPYGMHYGSSEDLYKIFIKPFTDIFHTAAGKTKEISVRTQTLAKTVIESIASVFIPRFENKYKKIFEKEKKQLDKVKSQYSDIYKANWDAFRDNDALCAAFMYSPAMLLTATFVRKSPRAAGQLISVLSGGTLDPWLERISNKMGGFDWWGKDERPKTGLDVPNKAFKHGDNWHNTGAGYGYGGYGESRIYEKSDKKGDHKIDIVSLLSSDKVKQKLQQSDVVQSLERQGKAIIRATLEQVFKQAQAALSAKTLQDIQTKTGVNIPELANMSQLKPEEKQKAEQAILASARKGIKELFVKNLTGQVKVALEAGIDENSEYIQDYKRVIAKIQAL